MIDSEQKLFEELSRAAASVSVPPEVVWGACVNLLVNAIRQTTAERKTAEAIFNQLLANAKTMLLDVHYDPATGKRRNVFPFTHVVQPPYVPSESTIFHGS